MKLWVDADAVPRDVKDIVFRAAERLSLHTILVANQRVQIPLGYTFVSAERVEGGPDVADRFIEAAAEAGDVAITADIPLASALVAKRVAVLDHRGEEFTPENVGERLSVRDFLADLRSSGVETGGPATYSSRDKQAFASGLDRMLTRALRRR
jgi:uncharacterized protein YaiI (UPF0178 family)